MHLIYPGPDEAMLCLRAVHSVVARAEGIPSAVRTMMTAAQRLVLHTDADLDALVPITPAELAAGISTPGLGDQVVQAMLLGVIAAGEPDPACDARAEAFATALASLCRACARCGCCANTTSYCSCSTICAARACGT